MGDAEQGGGRLTAPMPGKVIAVLVERGQKVEAGTPLIVMEAMKMEHDRAPSAGVVAEVLYGVGDQVSDGAQLLMMAAEQRLSHTGRGPRNRVAIHRAPVVATAPLRSRRQAAAVRSFRLNYAFAGADAMQRRTFRTTGVFTRRTPILPPLDTIV